MTFLQIVFSCASVCVAWWFKQFEIAKGLAKLGNIVAETLLRRQMFPSLAARETYVAATNFAARKQKMFLPEVKNSFVSRTQILRPKQMFPSLATTKTMLTSFQCRSLITETIVFPSNGKSTDNKNGRLRRNWSGSSVSLGLFSGILTFLVQASYYDT